MIRAEARLRGLAGTARIRLGGALLGLGGLVHLGLIDLAVAVEPRLVVAASGARGADEPGRRPWVGLLVVALLLAGALFTGETGYRALVALAPHRESRP